MKKYLFYFLFLFLSGMAYSQHDVTAKILTANSRFRPPLLDTTFTPGRIGERVTRPQDKRSYIAVSLTPGTKRWEREALFSEIMLSGSGWSLTGNNGTTPGTNFLGTTDQQGIEVRTGNIPGWKFDTSHYLQLEKIKSLGLDESDYEIDIFPDLQMMTKFNPAVGRTMFEWVRDNEISQNIQAVISTGDLCDTYGSVSEMDTISQWFDILDDADIPNVPILGNHDYTTFPPTPARNITTFNAQFPPSRYATKPWYGGNYDGTNANYFINFDAGGRKYTVFGLEFFPRDGVLTWASNIIDSMPDREVMLTTHGYITVFGERSTDTSRYSANDPNYGGDNTGVELWQKLGRKHKNIKFMFGGHFIEQTGIVASHKYFSDVGIHGNVVHQFLVNYQQDTLGGNGYFMRMKFRPASSKVDISLYSSNRNWNDTRYPPYAINFPNIQIEQTVGIKGDLSVNGALRADSGLYVAALEKFNIPFIGENNKLRDTTVFRYDYLTGFVNSQKLIVSPGNTYSSNGFAGGTAGQLYVVHAGGNYGITVTRAANDAGAANITFYKTRNTNPATRTAVIINDVIGLMGWHAVTSDASQAVVAAEMRGIVEATGPSFVAAAVEWAGLNTSGSFVRKMKLSANGNLIIGNNNFTDNASSILTLNSTTQGILPPRMTAAQRIAITPVNGLFVYDTDSARYFGYNGGWRGVAWTGEGGGSGATGANPTATVGLSAVNGVATTFMRSDASPALSQSIAPTWTGVHTFDNNLLMLSSRMQQTKGADVASANDLTLGNDGNAFGITGTTQINAITTTDWQAGSKIELLFSDATTVKHNTAGGAGTAPILLAGSTDLTTDVNTVLLLVYNGTQWEESSRKMSTKKGNYDFLNGLTESPVGTVKLGGNLTATTSIGGDFTLNRDGNLGSQFLLSVTNSHASGNGIIANAGTFGVRGATTGGFGIYGYATNGTAGGFQATTGAAGIFQTEPTTNNTSTLITTFRKTTSHVSNGANGIGGYNSYELETDNGAYNEAGRIDYKWTDAALLTRTSKATISGVNNAVLGDIISFEGNKRTMIYGRLEKQQGADVASVAGAIALGLDGNSFEITGTDAITLISNLNWVNGSEITLWFTSTATLTDGTANSGTDIGMELAGNVNFVGSAGASLTLQLIEIGGTQRFREKCRSVN